MSKRITGHEFELSKIFSSDFDYVIPSYQRPYSWTKDQTGELFDDLYEFYEREKEDSYFLGSIVLIKNENAPLAEVIDGQQRLTTLTILLAAIAYRLTGKMRDSCENFVVEAGNPLLGRPAKPRLALRDRDRDFFARYVQTFGLGELLALDTGRLDNEAKQHIQANTALLLARIDSTFNGSEDRLTGFVSFLLTRTFLVVVATPSEQSAFRVFSVLNSRGLDLLPTDILKATLIGESPEQRRDALSENWEELEEETGRQGFVDPFGHIWMIFARSKARASLLDEFRAHVRTQAATAELVITQIIEPHADAYLIAKRSSYKATTHAAEVNRYLAWLNRIDFSDWLPVAIRFIVKHGDDPAYMEWFFQRLERLAAFLHVCAYSINERIDRFATVLADLERPSTLESPVTTVELSEGEKAQMRAVLDGDVYLLTARRRNYIILRLDSFVSDGAASHSPDTLTIEHVLPQSVRRGIGVGPNMARRGNASPLDAPYWEPCPAHPAQKLDGAELSLCPKEGDLLCPQRRCRLLRTDEQCAQHQRVDTGIPRPPTTWSPAGVHRAVEARCRGASIARGARETAAPAQRSLSRRSLCRVAWRPLPYSVLRPPDGFPDGRALDMPALSRRVKSSPKKLFARVSRAAFRTMSGCRPRAGTDTVPERSSKRVRRAPPACEASAWTVFKPSSQRASDTIGTRQRPITLRSPGNRVPLRNAAVTASRPARSSRRPSTRATSSTVSISLPGNIDRSWSSVSDTAPIECAVQRENPRGNLGTRRPGNVCLSLSATGLSRRSKTEKTP